jgi:nucleoside-diphosphate-sugar epimerase
MREMGDLLRLPAATLQQQLHGADIVFHLAGRAHRADRGRDQRLAEAYRRDNVTLAERLYSAALAGGVDRFVHISTIKVLGDVSSVPLTTDAPYAPADVYGRSKQEAEQCLRAMAVPATALTIVRPPLVYGPGVRGNFARLISLVQRGWPLPLGCADANRSLVYMRNLCELLSQLGSDSAPLRIVHVRDDDDLSVVSLVSLIGVALGQPARCVAVPRSIMRAALTLTGNATTYSSLFEALCVDDTETRKTFAWSPEGDVAQAIGATVAGSIEAC